MSGLRAFVVCVVYGEHGGRPGRREGKNVGARPVGRVLARDVAHANAFRAELVEREKEKAVSEYRVVWEIDVDATSEVDAARQAAAIMSEPCRWTFTVTKHHTSNTVRVDLEEEDSL